MFVIHLEHVPDILRAEIAFYAQEIAPYFFVSTASAKIRQQLWNKITSADEIAAILLYTDATETGYSIETIGYPAYELGDFDGLQLVCKPANALTAWLAKQLWAKKVPFKSLIDHMLETGITAGCLIDTIFHPLLQQLSVLSTVDEYNLKQQIVFVCAMHDIGKCHPIFQGRNSETLQMLENYDMDQTSVSKAFRHEQYGAKIIQDLLELENPLGFDNFDIIQQIIGLHHQKNYGSKCYVKIKKNILSRWTDIQQYIFDFMKEVFPYDQLCFLPKDATKEDEFVIVNGILGILITSDWIASNESVFDNLSYKDFPSIEEFKAYKEKQLKKFMHTQHLLPHQYPNPVPFKKLFPFGEVRPMQQDVEDIMANERPKFMLIESGCGSGKTEAALYAASVMGWQNGKSGIYMGLPTSASAEAIQERIDGYLESLDMGQTKLFTSKSMLLRDLEEHADFTDVSRQRMLEPSAVGTVDQVMTVARKVKFESVRMAGLSSKVLIIDEIHAYDSYMMTTIEHLLRICNAVNIPVILLSATLPAITKKQLFMCYGVTELCENNAYPLISYITDDGRLHQKASVSYEKEKKITCEMLPFLDNTQKVAETALSNVKNGGTECVIMNTVNEAIDVYDEIKKNADDGCIIMLYHARMPENSRKRKSEKILSWLGKDRSNRPFKLIVVGTQVLEQSLDIDFDYLMTAICPIDLILQRIGRWHRHDNAGTIREQWTAPSDKIQVIVPKADKYGPSGYVYAEYFLQATQKLICARNNTFVLPKDTPVLINAVYDNKEDSEKVKDSIKGLRSNEGNINIKNGFHLDVDMLQEKINDKYINVRFSKYETMPVAVLSREQIRKMDNLSEEEAIELYRNTVVTVNKKKVKDRCNFIPAKKTYPSIFRNVGIVDAEESADVISVNEEYGLKYLS